MNHEKVRLAGKEADTYVIPFGPLNLVALVSASGAIACGLADVSVLDRFNYPAARMRSSTDSPISDIKDLLDGNVRESNQSASALGIKIGMTGHEVLKKLYATP
jgi:uncharacterized protein YunC (DUF1805 family)